MDGFFAIRVPPRQLARALLIGVFCGYGALAFLGVVFEVGGVVEIIGSGAGVVSIVLLQALYLSRVDPVPRGPRLYAALVVQALLVLVPVVVVGPTWYGFPGFLAGSVLLAFRPVVGIPLAALTIAGLAVISAARAHLTELSGMVTSSVYLVTSATTCALAVYGLTVLARLVAEAQTAREVLARVSVERERLHFARNLHALLGQRLSSITLKGELVLRLIGQDDDRARSELGDVAEIAVSAAEEVRELSRLRATLTDVPDAELPAGAPREPPPDTAPRFAGLVLAIVLADLVLVAVVGVLVDRGPQAALLAAACAGAVALGVVLISRRRRTGVRTSVLLTAGMTVVTFLPEPLLGPAYHGVPAMLGGAIVLALPRFWWAPAWLLVLGGALLQEWLDPQATVSLLNNLLYTCIGYAVISGVVYGLATAAGLVVELHAARLDLSRLSVARERVRISKDVHDLLGLTLSAIRLKCELASRLLADHPARARAETVDVLDNSRRALADARTVIGGGHRLSLDDECRLVESVLTAAQIEVRLQREGVLPGEPAGTVLASVLREGVTNVLRHSDAVWCRISVRRTGDHVELDIHNDGVRPVPRSRGGGGTGLGSMTDRVTELGGQLRTTAGVDEFRLVASLPAG